jgi:iron(III) transport system permease protein
MACIAMIRFDTFTTAIYDQFQSTFSGPAANMLAACWRCAVWRSCCWKGVAGKARYARIGSGAAREQKRSRWAGWRRSLSARAAALVMLALGVPLMVLCRWLWLGGVENWMNADLWPPAPDAAARRGGRAADHRLRYPHRLAGRSLSAASFRLLEGCNYMTSSLPGIVTALALVTVTIHYARPIYQTEVTLFLAYLLMFMPGR